MVDSNRKLFSPKWCGYETFQIHKRLDLPLNVKILQTRPQQLHFRVFHKVENYFLELVVGKIKELQLVLDFYQTLYSHYYIY